MKTCQNCSRNFVFESEDFEFYKKIEVPLPTFCPECRMVRRFCFRNERTLYHGVCALTGKKLISMFNPEEGITVYERDAWWSDVWDPYSYGQEYDFSRPFFVQFQELLHRVPLPNLASSSNVNSPYVNHSQECKNSYLVFASHHTENVMYSMGALSARDSLDLYAANSAAESYDGTFITNVSRVKFSYGVEESLNSDFLQNSKNLSDCLGCVNLRNAKHCIFNKQYTKEDYERVRAKYDFGSFSQLQAFRLRFADFAKLFPRRYANLVQCVDVTGDNCITSNNCRACFDLYGEMQDSKYSIHGLQMRDGYDVYGFGVNAELMYEGVDVGINASRCICAVLTHGSQNMEYTYQCYNSHNLFGCVGLRKAEYCIFNKQYSKGDYEDLRARIISQMSTLPYKDFRGRVYAYGEFFPCDVSPFAYNETIAQEYAPLNKQLAFEKGYRWIETQERVHEVTIRSFDLPDHISDVEDSITSVVIGCEHEGRCSHQCSFAFRITPQELSFYRKYRIALPRICSNCRHYGRLALRNPFKLWFRRCQCGGEKSENGVYKNTSLHEHGTQVCGKDFETAFDPQRNDIVYCEQCYQMEI